MNPISPLRLVALCSAVLAASIVARAADPPSGAQLKTFVRPRKSSSTHDRAAEYVQKFPGFFLAVGNTKITPSGVGFICLLERAQGDQSQVWVRSQGLRGWALTSQLVALNHAETFFSQQIEANPRDSFAFLMRGIVRFENDDLERAFADVNDALRWDPGYVAAWVERAYLWQCRNRLDLALADVNHAIQLDSRNSYAYVERGVFHFSMKEHSKALRDFSRADELGSRSPVVHLCRGMIHLERGEADPAIAEFNHAITADPKRLDAYLGLATVYTLRSEHDKALATFNRAVELDLRSAEAHEARAAFLLSRGHFERALDDFNDAIRLEPTSAERIRSRARLHFEKGDLELALADLESALRLDPNDAESQQGRAWILATSPNPKTRNPSLAVASATRACELTSWKVPHGLATLAAAYSETGDFATAVQCQQQALGLLTAKDSAEREYRRLLDRYKAGKPYHRLSVLEEMRLQGPRLMSKTGDRSTQ